jgi:flagellar biosynthesis/type III secretory pathway protein FliH
MLREAAIPFLVGPRRVMLADPSTPPEPARVGSPPAPAVDAEEERRKARQAQAEQEASDERERLDGVLAALLDAARDLRAGQRGRLEEMQRVAVELSVAIASHVMFDRLKSGDFPMEELVRAAVKRLEPRQAVTVYLHPTDLALLERRVGNEALCGLDGDELRLVGDAALARGACRAETGDVAVMANLEEHVAEIRRDLLLALPGAEIERRQERGLRRFPERRHTA